MKNILFLLIFCISVVFNIYAESTDRETFIFCNSLGLLNDSSSLINSENLSPANKGIIVSEIIDNIDNIDYEPGDIPQLTANNIIRIKDIIIKYRKEAEYFTSNDIDEKLSFLDELKNRTANFHMEQNISKVNVSSKASEINAMNLKTDTNVDPVYSSDVFDADSEDQTEEKLNKLIKKYVQHKGDDESIPTKYADEKRSINAGFYNEKTGNLKSNFRGKSTELSTITGITGWFEMPGPLNLKAKQTNISSVLLIKDGPNSGRNYNYSTLVQYGISDFIEIGGVLLNDHFGNNDFSESVPDRFYTIKYAMNAEKLNPLRFSAGYRSEIGNGINNNCLFGVANLRVAGDDFITEWQCNLNIREGSNKGTTADIGLEIIPDKWLNKASVITEIIQNDENRFNKFNFGVKFNSIVKLSLIYMRDEDLNTHSGVTAISWVW